MAGLARRSSILVGWAKSRSQGRPRGQPRKSDFAHVEAKPAVAYLDKIRVTSPRMTAGCVYFTVTVTGSDITGGTSGMWLQSPSTSCSVCWPGGSVTIASVWPRAEMHVLGVGRDRRLHLVGGQLGIDDEVMVPGVRLLDAGRREPIPVRPNWTLNGLETVSPFLRSTT